MNIYVNKGTLYCYKYYLYVHVRTCIVYRYIQVYRLQLKLDLNADFIDKFDFYFPHNISD